MSPAYISDGSGGQFSLNEATRTWTTLWTIMRSLGWSARTTMSPSLPPVRVSFRSGKGSSLIGLTFNPQFYELTMGWPIGWTDPEGSVTGFAAWLQRARSELSALPLIDDRTGE